MQTKKSIQMTFSFLRRFLVLFQFVHFEYFNNLRSFRKLGSCTYYLPRNRFSLIIHDFLSDYGKKSLIWNYSYKLENDKIQVSDEEMQRMKLQSIEQFLEKFLSLLHHKFCLFTTKEYSREIISEKDQRKEPVD